MAKNFMDENFLLHNETALCLYKAVKDEPIFDYHCHLIPSQIAENRQMSNLTDAWLSGDHYKWRMMRAAGIEEKYITADAPPYEKFLSWARTVENLIGNPLYHWTHLELQRYFGIYEPLTEKSAHSIWEKANALLNTPQLSVKGIFESQKIYAVGTTDDPIDNLEHHKAIAAGSAPIGKINTKVIPTFRPDKAMELNSASFPEYIEQLSAKSRIKITTPDHVLAALENCLEDFIKLGCRASDHGLEYVPYIDAPSGFIKKAFKKALSNKAVTQEENDAYKTYMLTYLASLYAQHNIVMQLHFNVIRNVNTKMLFYTGVNTGFDAVNDRFCGENLSALLDCMELENEEKGLPKTIIYSLNPKDYYPIAAIMGGFQDSSCAGSCAAKGVGKMQLGSAWWFCDNRDGIEEQMRVLANLGQLSAFIGMLTDSRSFLSYPRHEYFRRIMCNLLGKWAENGEYPADMEKLKKIAKDISFGNAKRYFE